MDGGKFKLSEVDTRAVSRGQNKLIDKFKMAAGDVISIRGQVMEYMYIPIGIKREIWCGLQLEGQVVGTVGRRPVAIHSSGQTISSLAHIG